MSHKKSIRKSALSLAGLASGAMLLGACSGVRTFEGQTALSVVGNSPAPAPTPAPPPPEPKKEEPPKRVEVRDNKIQINEKIQFEHAKANIKTESHDLLNEIADVLKKNKHITKVQIEGHASSDGNDGFNMTPSGQRAKAVMAYLVGKGIVQARMVSKGFGETKPIASNDTEEGREKNRRVEFNILKQDVTKTTVAVDKEGKEKVMDTSKGGTGTLQRPKP